MKYRVENELDLFEFHDAEFSFISFEKNELVLSAKHLNIHENAAQNPHDCDMEIDLAEFVKRLEYAHPNVQYAFCTERAIALLQKI